MYSNLKKLEFTHSQHTHAHTHTTHTHTIHTHNTHTHITHTHNTHHTHTQYIHSTQVTYNTPVPGLNLWGLLTPPPGPGTVLELLGFFFGGLGTLPPVDFLAVCFVLAIQRRQITEKLASLSLNTN